MNDKAKVSILKLQNVEQNIVIEADVEIRGQNRRRRFIVTKGTLNADIKKHIADRIIEEEHRNVIGEKFEVDL